MLSIAEIEELYELWNLSKLPYKPQGRDSVEGFSKRINNSDTAIFGIHDNGILIASMVLSADGQKGWINRIAIHPEYRRKGIAQYLIDFAENYFKEKGIGLFAALIEEDNHPSRSLFTKADYVEHRDIIYYSKRIDPDY